MELDITCKDLDYVIDILKTECAYTVSRHPRAREFNLDRLIEMIEKLEKQSVMVHIQRKEKL